MHPLNWSLPDGQPEPSLRVTQYMSISIRKAQPADTAALANLFQESRRRSFHWKSPQEFQLADFEKQTTGEVVWVAVDHNETILGFVSVYESDRFVHHLFVHPNYQRNEIGKLLLRSLDRWLARPYRLKCVVTNQGAREFYRKNGWLEIDRGVSEDGDFLLLEWTGAMAAC